MTASYWQLTSDHALLTGDLLQAGVDVRRPELGLSEVAYAGKRLNRLQPLAVEIPGRNTALEEEPHDAYVRGHDLVVTYQQTEGRTVRPQVYWRALIDAPAAGVELIVSMQTSLLDSDPGIATRTHLPEAEILRFIHANGGRFESISLDKGNPPAQFDASSGSSLFLFRLTGKDITYVEMVYPADFLTASLQETVDSDADEPLITLSYRLFKESLEKGVIRRIRAQGWLLPRQGDTDRAALLYRALAMSGPPLTA